MDWFLYDNGLRHEIVKQFQNNFDKILRFTGDIFPGADKYLKHIDKKNKCCLNFYM